MQAVELGGRMGACCQQHQTPRLQNDVLRIIYNAAAKIRVLVESFVKLHQKLIIISIREISFQNMLRRNTVARARARARARASGERSDG